MAWLCWTSRVMHMIKSAESIGGAVQQLKPDQLHIHWEERPGAEETDFSDTTGS